MISKHRKQTIFAKPAAVNVCGSTPARMASANRECLYRCYTV